MAHRARLQGPLVEPVETTAAGPLVELVETTAAGPPDQREWVRQQRASMARGLDKLDQRVRVGCLG